MARRKTRTSNLHRSTPEPEHGDWRVQVSNAEEVEHLVPDLSGFRNVWHRTRVVARVLQDVEPRTLWDYEDDDDPGIIPIHGWKRVFRLGIALLLLLPMSIVMVFALLLQLWHAAPVVGDIAFWLSVPVWYTGVGALLFVALIVAGLMQTALLYVYVLGHELTHAIAAKLCGGKVSSFRINADGGYIESDKDNSFIALAPYIVPLWMICWMGVLWLANLAFPFEEYPAWFSAGFGFWWFFHLYWTIWVIPREQPDMLENGLLFSLLTVIGVNVLILIGILMCFGVVTPMGYWNDLVSCTSQLGATLADLWSYLLH